MKKELLELRNEMTKAGVDIYIIPTGDFHGSEYIHDYFKTRKYISGFTGSAGTLVVSQDDAALWTDGRYFLQAASELEGSGIRLMKDREPGVPSISDYLRDKLASMNSPVIAFDGRTLPYQDGFNYEELATGAGGKVISNIDLVDACWTDRPELNGNSIWEFPLSSAGLPYEAKISQVRALMAEAGASYHLITTLDDNAWLFNLRGSDIERTPVFFSYTLITPDDVILYLFDGACPSELIPSGVTVKSYFTGGAQLAVLADLAKIPAGESILVSPISASYSIMAAIPCGVEIIKANFIPSTRLKACKNPVEIEATKAAHINDGIAMVNFINWLKKSISAEREVPAEYSMTEIGVSDYLENERRKLPGFIDLSFDTIAGYADHGAIVHYSATPETNAALKPEGFLLVDSGGQYMTGTTDITRTIALGPLTDKMKECYTTVLKGHLALAMAVFPDGTNGKDLDAITKAPLNNYGISYNHGTGHGVGHLLCVHENPNRINTISEEPIIPGMITSDEPGYYPEGEFGIRIENEILCVRCADNCCAEGAESAGAASSTDAGSPAASAEAGKYYCFENLTCCPYEREAIIKEMLTPEEITFVDEYHAWIYSSLTGKVDPDAEAWLKEVCSPL